MNPKVILRAGEEIAPVFAEGIVPAAQKAAHLAEEAVEVLMAPEKAAALKTAQSTANGATQNPMDFLSNATFKRVRSEGRVLDRWQGEPKPPFYGEQKLTGEALERMRASFGKFVSHLTDASGPAIERKLMRAHDVFDREFLPAVKSTGTRVNANPYKDGTASIEHDFPLNRAFRLDSGETVDLNKMSGLRKALAQNRDEAVAGTGEFNTFQWAVRKGRGAVPPQTKAEIFDSGDALPFFKSLRDPDFDAALTRKDGPVVPMRFEIDFPERFADGKHSDSVMHMAYIRFEEGAHLFQFLNEAPLTTMGVRLMRAARKSGSELSQLLKAPQYGQDLTGFVMENELIGVAQELRLPFRTSFAAEYHRSHWAVTELAPNPALAEVQQYLRRSSEIPTYARFRR